jgi:putative transposase
MSRIGYEFNNYFSYQKRKTKKPSDTTHQDMPEWVKDIARFSDNTYRERRIQKALNALSFPVRRRKAALLMKEANVWERYRKNIKKRQTANTTSRFTRMNLSKTLICSNLIKCG